MYYLKGVYLGESSNDLANRLNELPAELEDLYAHLYANIPNRHKESANKYFWFLLVAKHPLSILTLALTEPSLMGSDSNAQCSSSDLEKLCITTKRRLHVHCAGVLAINERQNIEAMDSNDWDPDKIGAQSIQDPENFARKLKSKYSLAKSDWPEMGVGFLHRTARDFLMSHTEFLNTKAAGCWSPLLEMSKAYIRRITLLPWVADLTRACVLSDVNIALTYISLFEQEEKTTSLQVMKQLVKAASTALNGIEPAEPPKVRSTSGQTIHPRKIWRCNALVIWL